MIVCAGVMISAGSSGCSPGVQQFAAGPHLGVELVAEQDIGHGVLRPTGGPIGWRADLTLPAGWRPATPAEEQSDAGISPDGSTRIRLQSGGNTEGLCQVAPPSPDPLDLGDHEAWGLPCSQSYVVTLAAPLGQRVSVVFRTALPSVSPPRATWPPITLHQAEIAWCITTMRFIKDHPRVAGRRGAVPTP